MASEQDLQDYQDYLDYQDYQKYLASQKPSEESKDSSPKNQSVGEALTGYGLNVLNGLTFGLGDEIAAGGNALLDAVIGGPGYDERLKQTRKLLGDFREQQPGAATASGIISSFGLPIPKVDSIKKGIALASGLGAGYGFGEGEGEDRLQNTALGAAIGGAGGAVLEPLAKGLANAGRVASRSSLGLRVGDYLKSLRQGGLRANELGDESTKLATAADEAIDSGAFPTWRSPESNMKVVDSKLDQVGSEIGLLLSKADEAGATPQLQFSKTEELIQKSPATVRGKLADALDSFKSDILDPQYGWDGSLSGLKDIKSSIGSSAFKQQLSGLGEKALSGKMERALYDDLSQAINSAVKNTLGDTAEKTLQGLNSKYKTFATLKTPLQQALTREEGSTLDQAIRMLLRTSGGVGVPLILGNQSDNMPLGILASALLLAGGTNTGRGLTGSMLKSATPIVQALSERVVPYLGGLVPEWTDTKVTEESKNNQGAENGNDQYSSNSTHTPNLTPISYDTQGENMPVNDKLLDSVRIQETGGIKNPNEAISKAGARGAYQFMMPTWKAISKKYGLPEDGWKDERVSRKGAEYLLNDLYDKYKDIDLALFAYNAGEPRVDKAIKAAGSKNPKKVAKFLAPETQAYAPEILARIGRLSSVV